ncbi:hypothetical protein L6R52_10210 [Myxococcota bacterium]|nr:hypothetical protein [Myxococcota bacterium]
MMKKLALVLFLLLAVQSYGVYGAAVTKKVTKTCTLEVGPLCYAWEDNAIGKLLGDKNSKQLDEALQKAKKAWEKDFIEKTVKQKSGSMEKLLDDVKGGLEDGVDTAKKAVEKAVDDLKK